MAMLPTENWERLRQLFSEGDDFMKKMTRCDKEISELQRTRNEANAGFIRVQNEIQAICTPVAPGTTPVSQPHAHSPNDNTDTQPSREDAATVTGRTANVTGHAVSADECIPTATPTPASGSVRKRGPPKSDDRYPALHPDWPMVVWIDGVATAIACDICHANAKAASRGQPSRGLMEGVRGLHLHMTGCHLALKGISVQDVVNRCQRTVLEDEDAERVSEGLEPVKIKLELITGRAEGRESMPADVGATPALPVQPEATNALSTTQDAPITARSLQDTAKKAPQELESIHDNYRSVIYLSGQWTSISCHLCSANATAKHGVNTEPGNEDYLSGAQGLTRHSCSGQLGSRPYSSRTEALALCNKTVIDDASVVERMRNGEIVPSVVEKRPGDRRARESTGASRRSVGGTPALRLFSAITDAETGDSSLPEPNDEEITYDKQPARAHRAVSTLRRGEPGDSPIAGPGKRIFAAFASSSAPKALILGRPSPGTIAKPVISNYGLRPSSFTSIKRFGTAEAETPGKGKRRRDSEASSYRPQGSDDEVPDSVPAKRMVRGSERSE